MIDVLLPHLELRPFIRGYIHNVIDFSLENLNNTYFFTPTHKKFIMLYLGSSVEVTFENKKKEKKKDKEEATSEDEKSSSEENLA